MLINRKLGRPCGLGQGRLEGPADCHARRTPAQGSLEPGTVGQGCTRRGFGSEERSEGKGRGFLLETPG